MWITYIIIYYSINYVLCIVNYTLSLYTLKKAKKNGAGEGNRTLATSLEGWGSTIELHPQIKNGRSSRIRTCDPLVPSQVRYQTALCPVINYFAIIANPVVDVNHYSC